MSKALADKDSFVYILHGYSYVSFEQSGFSDVYINKTIPEGYSLQAFKEISITDQDIYICRAKITSATTASIMLGNKSSSSKSDVYVGYSLVCLKSASRVLGGYM